VKKRAFEPTSEVQRAWNRAADERAREPSAPLSFAPRQVNLLYPLMKADTLRNTSSDWWAHPEIFVKARSRMVSALMQQGISDEVVLSAVSRVPRHVFVDEAFYLRAYDDDALPIGHGQTISHPSTVAGMISLMRAAGSLRHVLEIGTGCGYQAAVLAMCAEQVYTIERVALLYDLACVNLGQMASVLQKGAAPVHVKYGDGMLGWPDAAPFDGIILAAAGLSVPQVLLEQLRIGGVLVAPVGERVQRLERITRLSTNEWRREVLDAVNFVPLLGGVTQG
jgi:protein-L-isoaspartate(D-aspartate) O-methyltransferase